MSGEEILDRLVELARGAGLRVQLLRSDPAADAPVPESAVCRVYGEVRIVLAAADPVERRIELVAAALREHAPRVVEERFLPPAVRVLLERDEDGAVEGAAGAGGSGGPGPEAEA